MNIRASVYRVSKRVYSLKKSEIRLIIIALIMILAGVKQGVFLLTGWDNLAAMDAKIDQAWQQSKQLEDALALAERPELQQQQQQKQQELRRLELQLAQLARQVDSLNQQMVEPQRMTVLLSDMLANRDEIKLMSVEKLPIAPLEDEQKVVYGYQHKFKLVLQTDYVSLMSWLADLEKLPDRIFWHELELITTGYPNNRVTLIVYTISENKGWLGV